MNRDLEPGELVRLVRQAADDMRARYHANRGQPCGCNLCVLQREGIDALEGLMPPWWMAQARAHPEWIDNLKHLPWTGPGWIPPSRSE